MQINIEFDDEDLDRYAEVRGCGFREAASAAFDWVATGLDHGGTEGPITIPGFGHVGRWELT